MRRVVIIGCGGSGKSTLARRLGRLTRLPVVHLDPVFWRPGWEPTPRPEFARRVDEVMESPAWIIDGHYAGTLEPRLHRADTVVWLDYATWRCLLGIVRRNFAKPGSHRPDRPRGCPERLTPDFIWWVASFRWRRRARLAEHLSRHAHGTVIRLTGPAHAERWLNTVR